MIYKNIKQYFFLLIMISNNNFFFTYEPKKLLNSFKEIPHRIQKVLNIYHKKDNIIIDKIQQNQLEKDCKNFIKFFIYLFNGSILMIIYYIKNNNNTKKIIINPIQKNENIQPQCLILETQPIKYKNKNDQNLAMMKGEIINNFFHDSVKFFLTLFMNKSLLPQNRIFFESILKKSLQDILNINNPDISNFLEEFLNTLSNKSLNDLLKQSLLNSLDNILQKSLNNRFFVELLQHVLLYDGIVKQFFYSCLNAIFDTQTQFFQDSLKTLFKEKHSLKTILSKILQPNYYNPLEIFLSQQENSKLLSIFEKPLNEIFKNPLDSQIKPSAKNTLYPFCFISLEFIPNYSKPHSSYKNAIGVVERIFGLDKTQYNILNNKYSITINSLFSFNYINLIKLIFQNIDAQIITNDIESINTSLAAIENKNEIDSTIIDVYNYQSILDLLNTIPVTIPEDKKEILSNIFNKFNITFSQQNINNVNAFLGFANPEIFISIQDQKEFQLNKNYFLQLNIATYNLFNKMKSNMNSLIFNFDQYLHSKNLKIAYKKKTHTLKDSITQDELFFLIQYKKDIDLIKEDLKKYLHYTRIINIYNYYIFYMEYNEFFIYMADSEMNRKKNQLLQQILDDLFKIILETRQIIDLEDYMNKFILINLIADN